jgi:hypothetical protein
VSVSPERTIAGIAVTNSLQQATVLLSAARNKKQISGA